MKGSMFPCTCTGLSKVTAQQLPQLRVQVVQGFCQHCIAFFWNASTPDAPVHAERGRPACASSCSRFRPLRCTRERSACSCHRTAANHLHGALPCAQVENSIMPSPHACLTHTNKNTWNKRNRAGYIANSLTAIITPGTQGIIGSLIGFVAVRVGFAASYKPSHKHDHVCGC